MNEHEPITGCKFMAFLTRDPAVTIMFAISLLLTVMYVWLSAIIAQTHDIEILKYPLVATAAFAAVGIVFGIVRSLRMSRAARNRI